MEPLDALHAFRCSLYECFHRRDEALFELAERQLDHLFGSDVPSRFAGGYHYSWVEGYLEWLEGKEARAPYHALLKEELASLRG